MSSRRLFYVNIKMEAAPRLELGIKDLQSSALPLGYAATPHKTFNILTLIIYPVKLFIL